MDLVGQAFHCAELRGFIQFGKIDFLDDRVRVVGQDFLFPACRAALESQPECIMLHDNCAEGPLEHCRIERCVRLVQQSLVEMMQILEFCFEEPALDCGLYDRAGYEPLFGKNLARCLAGYGRSKIANCLMFEQLLGREVQALARSPRNDLDA